MDEVLVRIAIILSLFLSGINCQACSKGYITFELITGYVYTAPSDTLELLPGTLQLTECLSQCRKNASCQSVNFETGLCVLFSSSAVQHPSALTASQFPVFTVYAHKICLFGTQTCKRDWMFERVTGYRLIEKPRKKVRLGSLEACMEVCLAEREFLCRSANYDTLTGDCYTSDVDRHTVTGPGHFAATVPSMEYIESNCVDDPIRLCEFRKIPGKILKTVDAVYQDVKTLEECRRRCLTVNHRCHSFDFGDPANSVCRISHHASATLSHIHDPYLEIPGASTFELTSCFSVTIHCKAKEMVATVQTSKLFNGKVYVKSRPNSCVTDVINSLNFEIKMSYHDLNCDVKQKARGQFSNDIVIQHHDMIVTNQDLGLSVHCQYDLTNKSVSHGVQLEVNGEVEATGTHSATVNSPNVTMKITDRLGKDIYTAQVGDQLALRFEVSTKNSPYEIFVRELIAMDGIDNSEILLIDSLGCPTDAAIMGALIKVKNDGQVLQAPFDAFKFPTSEIVQFKALVTPCLPNCQPAMCNVANFEGINHREQSYGKRRRKRKAEESEDLVVVQTVRIVDKFGFERNEKRFDEADESNTGNQGTRIINGFNSDGSACVNVVSLVVACILFLIAQLILLLVWFFVCQRQRTKFHDDVTRGFDAIYTTNRRENSQIEQYAYDNPTEAGESDVNLSAPQ
ncbi:uncharacterized protein [Centruroides vittatus]|uniref:uncharacterized protein n=1 Tax=Centruroides vittatus TaxID=120091 RepID=UPI00350F5262